MSETIYYKTFDPQKIEIASIDKKSYRNTVPFHSINLKYVSGNKERKFFSMGLPIFKCQGIRKFEDKETQEGGKYSLEVKFEKANQEHQEFARKWSDILQRLEKLLKEAYKNCKDKEQKKALSKIVSEVKNQEGEKVLFVNLKDPIKLFDQGSEGNKDLIDNKALYFKVNRNFKGFLICEDEQGNERYSPLNNIEVLKNFSFDANITITFNWIYIGSSIFSLVTTVTNAYIYKISAHDNNIPSFVKENTKKMNLNKEEDFKRILSPYNLEKMVSEEQGEEKESKKHIEIISNMNDINNEEDDDE